MVELVHAGRSPEKLAEEFEPTAQSIRNWVAQAPITMRAGVPTALTTTEREELERLRRENRQLKLSGREARMVVFEFIEGLLQSHAAGHSSIGLYGILSGQLEHRFSPIDFERHLPASPDAHQHAVVLAAVKDKPFGRPQAGPSLTAAARAGRIIVRAGTEEWLHRGTEQKNGLQQEDSNLRSHILIPSPQLPTKPGQVQNRLGAARVSN